MSKINTEHCIFWNSFILKFQNYTFPCAVSPLPKFSEVNSGFNYSNIEWLLHLSLLAIFPNLQFPDISVICKLFFNVWVFCKW